jgi:MoaA/NifB/PqqE/SkfB family radical SAM enzyme
LPRDGSQAMAISAVDRLTQVAASERVPLYAMLELTWRCNFQCIHCYQEGLRDSHDELSSLQWTRVLDELADLGCVFLVLTGGEALVRDDFADIYRHAIRRGFVVTVFTNGALIDDHVLALFAELPPRKLEVTLYGTSEETYREVTGHADGFGPAMGAIDRLSELGVLVELKAPAIRPLVGELDAMAAFAGSRGLSFRADPWIFPRRDGSRAPLAHRLSPEEIVLLEEKRPDFAEWIELCFAGAPDADSHVYRCGAGSNSLGVDPSGHIVACPISPETSFDWRQGGTESAWKGLAAEAARRHAEERRAKPGRPGSVDSCGACTAREGCSRCPGKSFMETGDAERPVIEHCRVSALKLRLLRQSA